MMSKDWIPLLPLSLQDLRNFYITALRECEFLVGLLRTSLNILEGRMKPSAIVSSQFNTYESYYCAFLEHLKWKVSPLCIDSELPISKHPSIQNLLKTEYKHSGIGHPIDEQEINPLLRSLERVIENLKVLIEEIEKNMLKSIFLSHSSADKEFARDLAKKLTYKGAKVWLDEAEIKIGDSLMKKLEEGIAECDYLGVILSKVSVQSNWVQKEVDMALTEEIKGGKVKVLPILKEPCNIPGFLVGKLYADFKDPRNYDNALKKLLARLQG